MNEVMRYRPSPAMVVALLALFVAFVAPAIGKYKSPGVVHAIPPKNSVGAAQIKPNAVGASEIKTNAVTGKDVAQNGIKPGTLAPGSVVGSALANGSVSSAKIQTDAVGSAQIAPRAVTQLNMEDGSVGTSQIQPRAITAEELADAAVVHRVFAAAAVISSIANGDIDSDMLADQSVSGAKIQTDAVGPTQIAPGAVLQSKIADNAVGTPQIGPSAITATKLAANSVVGTALANGVVTSTKLADGSVATGKLADDSISGAKLKTDAVGPTQIAPGAVLQSKIGGGAVGTPQLSNTIPSASAFKDTATTWTNNGYTAMHYPSETFDTANLHSASPDYRMTAPVAGIYQATAVATWANDGCGGTRSLEFDGRRADGSTPFLPSPFISSTVPANGGSTTSQTLTGMIQLAAGESLEIWGGAGGMSCGTTETLGTPAASLTMTYMNPGP